MPAAFLFVNKGPDSALLSRSGGLERSEIFSHAQGIGKGGGKKVVVSKARTNSPESKPIDCCEKRSADPRKKHGNLRSKRAALRVAPPKVASPQTFVDGNGDPFSALSVSVSPRVQYLLGIYKDDIAPLLFPVERIHKASQEYTLSLAYQDPLVHHSLLTLVWARLYNRTRQNTYHVLAMASKHEALHHLRALLSRSKGEPIHTSHCYAIALLIWIECVVGDPEGVRAHASGLQSLLPRADDVDVVCVYILRLIYACSYLCTGLLHVPPPDRPVQPVSRSSLSSSSRAAISRSQKSGYTGTGHSFFLPPNVEILGSALTPIVLEFQELIVLRKFLASNVSHDTSEVEERYVCLQEAVVERDLVAAPFEHALSPQQDAIRLAMLNYSALPLVAATGPSAAASRVQAKYFRRNLEKTDLAGFWGSATELLLWVLVLGAFVCRSEDEEPWFQHQICLTLDKLEVASLSDMNARLASFCGSSYLADTIDAAWHEYQCRTWLRTMDST